MHVGRSDGECEAFAPASPARRRQDWSGVSDLLDLEPDGSGSAAAPPTGGAFSTLAIGSSEVVGNKTLASLGENSEGFARRDATRGGGRAAEISSSPYWNGETPNRPGDSMNSLRERPALSSPKPVPIETWILEPSTKIRSPGSTQPQSPEGASRGDRGAQLHDPLDRVEGFHSLPGCFRERPETLLQLP